MGLHFSWNLDDSYQSGSTKDFVPDPCVVQNNVSPQHPVDLLWLAQNKSLTLAYCFLSMKSRKATLLQLSSSKARIRELHGSAWLRLVSISTDLSSGVMVNCLWNKMCILSTLLVCPCKYPRRHVMLGEWHHTSERSLRHDEGSLFSHKRWMSMVLNLLSFLCHPARHSRRQYCLQLHKHTPSKTWRPHAGTAHRQHSCSCS